MNKTTKTKPVVDSQGHRITGGMCSGGCGYKAYLADGYCKACWKKRRAAAKRTAEGK